MTTQRSSTSVSRRKALAGLGAGSLGLALAAPARARAQQASLDDHPLVGTWLLSLPGGVAPAVFAADGSVSLAWQVCGARSTGAIEYTTAGVGTWQSTGERSAYINVVQVISNDTGAFVGTRSLHLYPEASVDRNSLFDDGMQRRVVVRDSANNVTAIQGQNGDMPAISGIRMSPGSPGFPLQTGSPAEQ